MADSCLALKSYEEVVNPAACCLHVNISIVRRPKALCKGLLGHFCVIALDVFKYHRLDWAVLS